MNTNESEIWERAQAIVATLKLGPDINSKIASRLLYEWREFLTTEAVLSEQWATHPQKAREELGRLRKLAEGLLDAIGALSTTQIEVDLAWNLGTPVMSPDSEDPGYDVEAIKSGYAQLRMIVDSLVKLEKSAKSAVHNMPGPRRGRREKTELNVLVQILSELFHHLTGEKPVRKTIGQNQAKRGEPGQEYGAFWEFLRASWVFAGRDEAEAGTQIRQWAEAEHRGQSSSQWLKVMHQRHPEWGIFPGAGGE